MNARRPWLRLITVAALSSALAATLSGCGEDDADPGATASDTQSDETEPSEPPTTSPATGSSTSPVTEPSTVPAYFVADTPQGPRLFREFRNVETDDPLNAAADLVTTGEALDPDYRSLFPAGQLADVAYDDQRGVFVAELAGDAWATRAPGMTRAEAGLAVQQLVHTLQGVAQTRAPVTFTLGGSPTPIFGIDAGDGISNAPALSVLGLVSVTTPEQGGTVSGSFTASGVASSFEATVPWELRRGPDLVAKGFATAEGWMDKLYPWETEIPVSHLMPGEYMFIALTDDPSGGAEGGGPTEDSKTITVR